MPHAHSGIPRTAAPATSSARLHTKDKGDIGEAMVTADALRRGHKVAIPIGENGRYDLIVERRGRLERVQVKYAESDGRVLRVKCCSTNNWCTIKYCAADVDWLAVYDRTTDRCYYIPGEMLGDGRSAIHLRLAPTKNRQKRRVLWASDFTEW
jgi:hypothetical protein